MILANLMFCGDSLQFLHAKSWHYSLKHTSDKLKYKLQSRQLKQRTSVGFNNGLHSTEHRSEDGGREEARLETSSTKNYRRGCQPVSPRLQGFQAQLPCWHSVPHPTEELCLGRINPHCEREQYDATEVDITRFITR